MWRRDCLRTRALAGGARTEIIAHCDMFLRGARCRHCTSARGRPSPVPAPRDIPQSGIANTRPSSRRAGRGLKPDFIGDGTHDTESVWWRPARRPEDFASPERSKPFILRLLAPEVAATLRPAQELAARGMETPGRRRSKVPALQVRRVRSSRRPICSLCSCNPTRTGE